MTSHAVFVALLAPLAVLGADQLRKVPVRFEPNVGQTGAGVKYFARSRSFNLFLTSTEAVLASRRGALRIRFEGANRDPRIEGLDRLPGTTNYLRGTQVSRWKTSIPGYARVRYSDLYPGIDLLFYGGPEGFEYDWVVRPDADLSKIRVALAGADQLKVDSDGDLVARVGRETFRHHKPLVYQGDERRPVAGRYVLRGKQVTFEVTPYDRRSTLVIDPVLSYSTYLGGASGELPNAIAVDAAGNAYITGQGAGTGFPTTAGALKTVPGSLEAFVSKINPDGTALVYSTYLGGSGIDEGDGIAVDQNGNAYVAGTTGSSDFPTTPGAFKPKTSYISDRFIAKLNPGGTALVYSTYLGIELSFTTVKGIAIDAAGSAYVTGYTSFDKAPVTAGALQSTLAGCSDAFVFKLNPAGSALQYGTYLGGTGCDQAHAIAVDASGNVYVTGETTSSNFPITPGALRTTRSGTQDSFVAKLNAAGTALVYSTFLGGSDNDDHARGIAVDASGNAYVTGFAYSTDFPTVQAFQAKCGCGTIGFGINATTYGDAFVTKLNAGGSAIVYSTYLGGQNGADEGQGIAVDPAGYAVVVGAVGGYSPSDFPVVNPVQSTKSVLGDMFVAKFDPSGSLIYSTYFGGDGTEFGKAVAVDAAGNAYLTGNTDSSNMPVSANALQKRFAGGSDDGFVVKISDSSGGAPAFAAANVLQSASYAGGAVAPGEVVVIFGSGIGPASLAGPRLTPDGRVDTLLAGTRVLFDDVPAPLIYASATQTSAIVPYAVDGKSTTRVQIEYQGVRSSPIDMPVRAAIPGMFTSDTSGKGQGAILNADFSVNSSANPAAKDSFVMLYLTGEGATTPAGIDGKLAADPLPKPNAQVTATIGGVDAEVIYAGGAPGLVAGVLQVNARIPSSVPSGNAEVIVTVGGARSQSGVTVAVK